METLSGFLVQQPLHILGVAMVLFLLWAARTPRLKSLLIAAWGWLAYAGWEWLVVSRTPEADIRVDLLLIWPLLAILTCWAAFRWVLSISTRRRSDE